MFKLGLFYRWHFSLLSICFALWVGTPRLKTLNPNVDFLWGKNNHRMVFYCEKLISIYLPIIAMNQIRRCEIHRAGKKVSKPTK